MKAFGVNPAQREQMMQSSGVTLAESAIASMVGLRAPMLPDEGDRAPHRVVVAQRCGAQGPGLARRWVMYGEGHHGLGFRTHGSTNHPIPDKP